MVWVHGSDLVSHRLLGVDQITQFFRRLEERHFLGWDIYFCPGFWIATDTGVALTRAETTKSANLDFVAGLEGTDDGIEEHIDDNLTVATGEVSQFCDFVDKVGLGQFESPFGPRG